MCNHPPLQAVGLEKKAPTHSESNYNKRFSQQVTLCNTLVRELQSSLRWGTVCMRTVGISAGMNKHDDSLAFMELHVILQDGEVYLEFVNVQSQRDDVCCDFSLH